MQILGRINEMDMNNLVKTSYSSDDVTILLKDLSGCIEALDTETREKLIQSGVHYSEMLPLEYEPTDKYMEIYNKSLEEMSERTADSILTLCDSLYKRHNGQRFVIISLARAGTPIGILTKRFMKMKYNIDCPHYSISIIRGKGIDENAMEYIYKTMSNTIGVKYFQFLDGWTGKGAINKQLTDAVNRLKLKDKKWDDLDADLAVLADPANICTTCGTHDDFLIPSACLNGTVSGLVSRTILNDKFVDINKGDFHGAVYFDKLEPVDKSIEFTDKVTNILQKIINNNINKCNTCTSDTGLDIVNGIANTFGIGDINMIKPGVGETTRVLLRRVPWKVLINTNIDGTIGMEHILQLCKEKNIPVEEYNMGNYRACGIIRNLSADV